MLNCVLLIVFYDLVLSKVIFSPNFLFFSFFPLWFPSPSPDPLIFSPPHRGGGKTQLYTGLHLNQICYQYRCIRSIFILADVQPSVHTCSWNMFHTISSTFSIFQVFSSIPSMSHYLSKYLSQVSSEVLVSVFLLLNQNHPFFFFFRVVNCNQSITSVM